jgi:hypothetical protein
MSGAFVPVIPLPQNMFETVGRNLRICEPAMKRLRTGELRTFDFEIENITGENIVLNNHIKNSLSIFIFVYGFLYQLVAYFYTVLERQSKPSPSTIFPIVITIP